MVNVLTVRRGQFDMPVLKEGSLVVIEGANLYNGKTTNAIFVLQMGPHDYDRCIGPRLHFVREVDKDDGSFGF